MLRRFSQTWGRRQQTPGAAELSLSLLKCIYLVPGLPRRNIMQQLSSTAKLLCTPPLYLTPLQLLSEEALVSVHDIQPHSTMTFNLCVMCIPPLYLTPLQLLSEEALVSVRDIEDMAVLVRHHSTSVGRGPRICP